MSLSYGFVIFLNTQGLLYASGDNSKGQLGLGCFSKVKVVQPQLVSYFPQQKEMIETVSVGMGHVVAKSKLGYVYTWGDNCFQQVSNQLVSCLHTPELIEIEDTKLRALQAVAGLRATFVLN